MEIRYLRSEELNFNPRFQMGMIFLDGFYQYFKVLNLDKETLARAFSHAFDIHSFYVAVTGNRIAAMAACTKGEAPLHFNKEICCSELGHIRGLIVYALLEKFIVNHKFPFDYTPSMGRIEIVATDPEFRGQGIAYNLLSFIMEDARYDEYVLDVLADNKSAIRLYSKLGFRTFQRENMPFYIKPVISDFLYMKADTKHTDSNTHRIAE